MSYCTNCGTKLESDAVFCENCGVRVYYEEPSAETIVQAIVNESNKNYYSEQLSKTLVSAVIAVVISLSFASMMGVPSDMRVFFCICIAGIPCGWSTINHILGGWTIIVGPIGFVFLFVRFCLAAMIGFFVLPVKIVYYIYKINKATKS